MPRERHSLWRWNRSLGIWSCGEMARPSLRSSPRCNTRDTTTKTYESRYDDSHEKLLDGGSSASSIAFPTFFFLLKFSELQTASGDMN